MNGWRKHFFWKSIPYEPVANPTESTQNLSPGRFWHAEQESDMKNLPIRHADLEMKENQLYFKDPFTGLPIGRYWMGIFPGSTR